MNPTPETVLGIPWKELLSIFPQLDELAAGTPVLWHNARTLPAGSAITSSGYTAQDVEDASLRLKRFAPFLAKVFPETAKPDCLLESPLRDTPALRRSLTEKYGLPDSACLLFKMDSELVPGSSLKARGGIYEVLKLAEDLSMAARLVKWSDNYEIFAEDRMREFFANFSISTASMGNLGIAVAMAGKAFGFKVITYVPKNAAAWKKSLLTSYGAILMEHDGNFNETVTAAREQSAADNSCFFVDDEYSRSLFLGYTIAGGNLKEQLEGRGITVNNNSPLYVYLPCGVGEAPSAVCFGLKLAYRDDVHVYVAEPTSAPAMLLGLGTGLYGKISALDIGLDTQTVADELSVGRSSQGACLVMRELLDGCVTVNDVSFLELLALSFDTEKIRLESSAVAGLAAFMSVMREHESEKLAQGTHIVWATGGGLLPLADWQQYYEQGALFKETPFNRSFPK